MPLADRCQGLGHLEDFVLGVAMRSMKPGVNTNSFARITRSSRRGASSPTSASWSADNAGRYFRGPECHCAIHNQRGRDQEGAWRFGPARGERTGG